MDTAPLLVATADPDALDDALRWCAAVGVTPEVASDAVAARRSWSAARAVRRGRRPRRPARRHGAPAS
ncbi:hypothetical protein QE370_000326 [Aeromicrobium sp. SORGH_AS981]|uniref:hypothetical protein n=1 Tax=Aeromicrobium sp. SORGH_AS_0981 TaxID=3041802 RepID=UPI002858262D|nr:hypothetical protein [Aeromicrobium sp. SORGH_AS_0981]MDR6117142.1 hypothetical protein [Aeromicrobium sp. SORGH_AS_0981]